jgi:hypothetical protein
MCFLFAQWHHEKETQARSAGAIGNIADAPVCAGPRIEHSRRPNARRLAVGSFLKLAEQDQDQDDNEYEAEPAAAVVAGPVEAIASEPAKAPSNAITKMMSRMVPSDMAISH